MNSPPDSAGTAPESVVLRDGTALPALGMGTWKMGERAAQRGAEVAALRRGLELGLTVIDTAEMYADGGSERVVGEALAGLREQAFVVTKVLPSNASRTGTLAACERSLERLRVEAIDLYLLHWRGSHPLAETLEAFAALLRAGKIRRWGVSNFDVADLRELGALPGGAACAANQVYYALSERGVEVQLLPWHAAHGVVTMAYCPLDEGRLLGHRALAGVARRHGATAAQVALAWLLRRPGTIVIPKSGRVAGVEENAAARGLRLDADDLAQLDAAFPPPARKRPLAMI